MVVAERKLETDPAVHPQASWEELPVAIDMSARLSVGETVSAAAIVLINVQTGTDYAGGHVDAPSIDGTGKIVTQWVRDLEPGEKYRLECRCTIGSRLELAELRVECPF